MKKGKLKSRIIVTLLTIYAIISAIVFLFPTVLTLSNSFMSTTEINANYGTMIDSLSGKSKSTSIYVSEKVNLKLIQIKYRLVNMQQFY